jgi:prolipoprotein diacylglyceryltransferase
MMSTKTFLSEVPFEIFLVIGLVCMVLCMCYVGRKYGLTIKQIVLSAVYMTVTGVFATYLMSYIEAGEWGGRSFFGAAFLVPVFMYPMAKVMKVAYGDMMDICAPAGCIMLALLKVKCAVDGCCYGRWIIMSTSAFRFPSQIVESIGALVLMAVLLIMIARGNQRRMIYPWCLFLYGIMRSVLNLLRETTPWLGPVPQGNVWAMLALLIGLEILIVHKRRSRLNAK